MTPADIITLRLRNQQLLDSSFKKPQDLISWMGAVQAQDYAGSKWAVGLRTTNATNSSVEEAINKGKIIRTHVLRPTWHLVSPDDVRWMLLLTAPRIHAFNAFGYRKLELTDAIFKQAHKTLINALQGGKHRTRLELATALQQAKIETSDLRLIHLLMHAELEGIICNGAKREKQFTYALLNERVPPTKTITREEALINLTERYFKSHGPATIQDYTWWSGLSATDAQRGLEMIKSRFVSETVNDKTYWMDEQTVISKNKSAVLLVPAFDEYTVAYKDRSLVMDEAAAKKTGNGIFKPLFIIDGKIKGIWKRNDKKGGECVKLTPFIKLKNDQTKKINEEVKRYGVFLGS